MKRIKELFGFASLKGVLLVTAGAILSAIAINTFYNSSGLYSLGVTGLSMIVASALEGSKFDVGMSFWLIVLNLPIMILGIRELGRRFTFYTILSIVLVSIFVNYVPKGMYLDDILLNALFGGMFFGAGITLTLKAGGSTGGTDVLSLYYSFKKEMSIGQLALMMNATIAILAGLQANVEVASYTIMGSFVTSIIVDKFHTRYKKLRVEIITEQADDLAAAILTAVHRGMTRVNVTGGYSKIHKEMLIIIITSYELMNIRDVISEVDPNAFVSISDCKGIIGNFFNNAI